MILLNSCQYSAWIPINPIDFIYISIDFGNNATSELNIKLILYSGSALLHLGYNEI